MPTQISSKDVLIYLNYLGYNNINAQQLKEFIRDLKKLIKYEEQKKLRTSQSQFNVTETTEYAPLGKNTENHKNSSSTSNSVEEEPDIFNTLFLQGTCASVAKIVPKKESVISLQIKKTKSCHKCDHHTVGEPAGNQSDERVEDTRENDEKRMEDTEKTRQSEEKKAPKAKSFIRPPIRTNSKSDPVALYHQYKAEWDRHKIPGENQRTELRWAVREKMLGTQR